MFLAGWQDILKKSFIKWEALADFLELTEDDRALIDTCPTFPLKVPYRLALKMEKKRLDDPLLKQFLPLEVEKREKEGFGKDPLKEGCFRPHQRLLQKYQGRALLVPTSVCAMHCRYCFRRHFDYSDTPGWDAEEEVRHIAQDKTLVEVILSGGDPLSLPERRLNGLIEKLLQIPHLRRLRFHTRFPIGIPERIDEAFLKAIEQCSQTLQVYFVLHSNHPRELDEEIFTALKKVQQKGAILLNQSVLLKGVNDSAKTLADLSLMLCDRGILPYYLHQVDPVQGAAHFEVEEERGRKIVAELQTLLPGYAVPRYVREVPFQPSKSLLF